MFWEKKLQLKENPAKRRSDLRWLRKNQKLLRSLKRTGKNEYGDKTFLFKYSTIPFEYTPTMLRDALTREEEPTVPYYRA